MKTDEYRPNIPKLAAMIGGIYQASENAKFSELGRKDSDKSKKTKHTLDEYEISENWC